MKLWIDDVRPAPKGYKWAQSVMMAQAIIEVAEEEKEAFLEKANYQLHHHNLQGFISFLGMASRRDRAHRRRP